MAKRVAVIGAGASGLAAIKCCLDEGLEPVCLERTDSIGGLWHYTDYSRDGESCVMKSTVINTSKEMMCFSDFPIPASFPNYLHNTKVMKYFHLYADRFNLKKHIRFETSVLKVTKADDFSTSGKWNFDIQDNKSGKVTKETYDAVLVCTGHHADKRLPNFEGMNDFQGKILHSHDYKHARGYEDKRVVVVGIGNSGGDAAVELSRVASQVFLSTRRGAWVIHRVAENGYPADMSARRRFNETIRKFIPTSVLNARAEARLNNRFDHTVYSLKPKHGVFAAHPTVNDDLPNRVACGSIIVKPNIKRLTKGSVEFEDGTVEDNIDLLFLGTGYTFGFPFIDKSVIDVKDNHADLYKFMYPPDLEHGTLAVIGYIQPIGAVMPISEMQCRLAARVFKGDVKLPSSSEMWRDIKMKQEAMRARYVDSPRHTIQVDWIPFMDELAEKTGCLPDIWSIFKKDYKLGIACYFGTCTPTQYRLMGPHPWEGAREAILSTWQRFNQPLATRKVPRTEKSASRYIFHILSALFLLWVLRIIFGL